MENKDVMDIPTAGKRLGLSRPTAYLMAKQGKIPTLRMGRKIVVPIVAFDRMLANAGTQPQPAGAGAK